MGGKHVVLIGQRRIMRKPSAGQRQPKQKRPVSRTLTAVHDSILEDLVYPTEIVGKHTRYRLDGSKICKVYLDPKEAPNVEYKVDTFATVYKQLTGMRSSLSFPPRTGTKIKANGMRPPPAQRSSPFRLLS